MELAFITFLSIYFGLNFILSFFSAFTTTAVKSRDPERLTLIEKAIADGTATLKMRLSYFAINYGTNMIYHWPLHILSMIPAAVVYYLLGE